MPENNELRIAIDGDAVVFTMTDKSIPWPRQSAAPRATQSGYREIVARHSLLGFCRELEKLGFVEKIGNLPAESETKAPVRKNYGPRLQGS